MSEPSSNASSREYFEQLGTTAGSGQSLTGSNASETLSGAPGIGGSGLPGALSFYSFANLSGDSFADLRGGPAVTAYEDSGDSAAVSATLRTGPDGSPNSALEFNGENQFAYLEHSPAWEISQGTIALWIQPDDVSDDAIILSKDLSGSGDGGHFRLGIEDDGLLFLRFATGDGSGNRAWESSIPYLQEGQWTHLAVSFSADEGITVYVDGVAVPDSGWTRKEGNEDLPSLASEAYLLANREPWVIGTDTSRTTNTDSPDAFAAEHSKLRDAFDGAIADFGIWGGDSADEVLTAQQVFELASNGPGSALTAPAGPQPMIAAADQIDGASGNDTILGEAGNDTLNGAAGHDSLKGGYGDDLLDGGDGDDVLEGGRGSDLLLGGDGDDVLISHSDAGEQRIGQLAIGQPTRPDPDGEVNPERQKLYGWEDQPLVADDILVGGDGADTFLFNPQINAKRDIILEHVNDDRTINWAGVAGENNELHDHWVDSFGIDVIADYVAGEDTISIVGHTVTPEVEQRLIDTDNDGKVDDSVSIITIYSNQGDNGGAHTRDLIGQIIVYGDPVDRDDIIIEAGVTHGVVETIDEIGEALAPTGTHKTSGYDTRDTEGNLGAVTGDPLTNIDNPYADSDLFDYASTLPTDLGAPVAVLSSDSSDTLDESMLFNAGEQQFAEVLHDNTMALIAGTIAFSFNADRISGNQGLFSKDASGWGDGGHINIELDSKGRVQVRLQGDDGEGFKNIYLRSDAIEAGETVNLALTFSPEGTFLYLNGEIEDVDKGFDAGIRANDQSLILGASGSSRPSDTTNKLKYFFSGTIENVLLLDRDLSAGEVLFLEEGILELGDPGTVSSLSPSATVLAALAEPEAPKVTSQSPGQPDPTELDIHDVTDGPGNASSREYFEQLRTVPGTGQTINGTATSETLSGAVNLAGNSLPGALSFYSFANDSGGSFADLRGGPAVTAYQDVGETAAVSVSLRAGPDGSPNSALEFNGENQFAYLEHSPAWEISQGTIALWIQPDDVSDDAIILSKDLSGSGDGG
ncbi:MAG: Ca2+-binding RTX toxin-like protein, partial [Halieaceae bacterium]